jgi:2-dehydropantoate 2-reductase
VRDEPRWRERLERVAREACAVAAADGADVDVEALVASFQAFPAPMRSSMQKDVAAGRPPELDAIAGPVLRGGERHGIPVPFTLGLTVEVAQRSGHAAGP